MPYATHHENDQTIQIHYQVEGKGEPIVFHHGNGNSLQDWYTLGYVNELANDFQLILIDNRGYGKSSKPHNVAAYSLPSRANDTIAVLNELKLDKVHCLGGSVGASMCFILAKYYPERFKSYIFATPYFTQFDAARKQALSKGTEAFVLSLEKSFGAFDNPSIRQGFLNNDANALWAANSSEWFDYQDMVQYINKPSLIFAGSLEPSIANLTKLALQLPQCELKILENVGHKEAYWNAKLTAPLIRNFLNQL